MFNVARLKTTSSRFAFFAAVLANAGMIFSAGALTPEPGDTIALKSPNGYYVTANNGSYWGTNTYNNLALVGNYNAPGDGYARFLIEDTGGGLVALKCLGNGKYLSVDSSSLHVNATASSITNNWQKWTIEESTTPDKIGFLSAGSAEYLNARSDGDSFFRADRTTMGTRGSFDWEVLEDSPGPPFGFVDGIASHLRPEVIGDAAAANLLGREHYWTSDGRLHYAEYYTANGALRFARVTENTNLFNRVFDRYNTPTWPYKDGTYTLTSMTNDATLFMGSGTPSAVASKRTAFILVEWYLSTGDIAYYNKSEARWTSRGGGPTSTPNADGMFSTPTLEKIFYELPALTPAEKTVCIDNMSRFLSGYTTPVMQKDNGLYMHHPTDRTPTDPLSFEVWGRGDGWCNMALAEGLTIMPDTDPQWDNTYRSYLKFMDGLLGYQHASGMWYQIMDRPGEFSPSGYANWLESSGTAMACYSMARGVKEGWLDANVYVPVIRDAWAALATRVDGGGALEDVCRGMSEARLGEGLDYYMNEADRNRTGDFHGQAPLLWLASEIIESDFNTWVMDYGLLGAHAFADANTDDDARSNFEEYAFGGDPTNAAVQGWPITHAMVDSAGTNFIEYVYPRRYGLNRGLTYRLELNDNLMTNTWVNAGYVEMPDAGMLGDNMESVTNRIYVDDQPNKFIRLHVERE